MKSKFTIQDFNSKYNSEDVCLDRIFQLRYGNLKKCPKCKKETNFYKRTDKKAYSCQWCGHLLSPLAGTIFHKSETALKNWFYIIYLFSVSKNGVSGKEIERQLGCTYKTAWRMAKQIRQVLLENKEVLKGIVEIEETYVGGKGDNNKRGRGSENKTPVFGMVERKGNIKELLLLIQKEKRLCQLLENTLLLVQE